MTEMCRHQIFYEGVRVGCKCASSDIPWVGQCCPAKSCFEPRKAPQDKFWLVWVPSSGNPQKRHTTMDEAVAEAKRLAKTTKANEVFVMEMVARVSAEVVVTVEELR